MVDHAGLPRPRAFGGGDVAPSGRAPRAGGEPRRGAGQRVSAVAVLLLGLWFAITLATMDGFSHAAASALVGTPVNSVLLLLLVVAMGYHSYLGVQVVIEDYVHSPGLKVFSLVLSRFVHVLFAAAGVFAILKIGLGA